MREAFSGTALFMIVIFFVVLFTGYLCMSINQNKAFAVKNSVVRIIERNGVGKSLDQLISDPNFRTEIRNELKDASYRSTGNCDGWVGLKVDGTQGSPSAICIMMVASNSLDTKKANPNQKLHYYKVKTFYQFDIPGFKDFFQWTIEGTTKAMM